MTSDKIAVSILAAMCTIFSGIAAYMVTGIYLVGLCGGSTVGCGIMAIAIAIRAAIYERFPDPDDNE